MLTYEEASERLQGRNRDRRKLENNTYLERRPQFDDAGEPLEDAFAVRLHATDVVTIYSDGSYVLSSGGWQTVTTKDRMNGYAPVRVSSVNREWFARHWSRGDTWEDRKPEYPFFDGIRFDAAGNVLNAPDWVELEREKKARQDLRKQIRKFAKSTIEKVAAGMAYPDAGDCFFCSMATQTGETLGDSSGNHDHLLSHVEEDYAPASLVARAVREYAGDDSRASLWLGWDGERFAQGFWVSDHVERAIKKYMAARLIAPGEGNGR